MRYFLLLLVALLLVLPAAAKEPVQFGFDCRSDNYWLQIEADASVNYALVWYEPAANWYWEPGDGALRFAYGQDLLINIHADGQDFFYTVSPDCSETVVVLPSLDIEAIIANLKTMQRMLDDEPR